MKFHYEFAIKNIRKNTTETKCVVKKICECDKSELSQKIKECKRPLIKNLQNDKKDILKLFLYPIIDSNINLIRKNILNPQNIIRHLENIGTLIKNKIDVLP